MKWGNSRGTSLVELATALFITSVIVLGVYKLYRFVDVSTTREKQKAELQRDIITVNNIIEHDIRMAGWGLPGNGVNNNVVDTANDDLSCFSNEQQRETRLYQQANPADMQVVVDDANDFYTDAYICLDTTCYRRITRIGMNSGSGPDTISLSRSVYNATYPAGKTVYPATRFAYRVGNNPTPRLQRVRNNVTVDIGGKLDSILVTLKDSAGNPVGASVEDAALVSVVIGGHIGKDGNRVFLAESTEINIRNVN
jgi:hypothetical protein